MVNLPSRRAYQPIKIRQNAGAAPCPVLLKIGYGLFLIYNTLPALHTAPRTDLL